MNPWLPIQNWEKKENNIFPLYKPLWTIIHMNKNNEQNEKKKKEKQVA